MQENWDLILTKYGAGLLLTHFVRDIVTPVSRMISVLRLVGNSAL